jgi:hypothetical protein
MNWSYSSSVDIDYDSEKELGEDTGFMENVNASFAHEEAENLSNSEDIVMMEDVNNAYAALHDYTGQPRFEILSGYANSVAGFDLDLRDLDAEQDLIIKLRQQHPDDTRLRTYSQMIADKKPELKALRERSQDVYDRAGVMGTVGTFLGTMGAHVKDPLFMYSLPFGAGPTTAKTALGRAIQVGAKEGAIAGVAEVPVSVSRYQWKEKIESPWSVWDAAEETLMVMVGTGLLAGVGYAIGDALGWTHAAKVARENGLEGEAQLLEKRARVIEESEAQGVSVEEVLQAEDEALQQTLTYKTVWHGSPHEFEQPDLSKVGTGEGAQAYGHGFYTAEEMDVAGTYSSNSAAAKVMYDGKVIPKSHELKRSVAWHIARFGSKDAARDYFAKSFKPEYWNTRQGKQELAWLDKLDESKIQVGHLYKLQVSDENIGKMLDWDKPLSEQSEYVRNALKDVVDDGQQLMHLYERLSTEGIAPQKIIQKFDNRDDAVDFFRAEKQRFSDTPMSSGKGTYEPVAKLDGDDFTVETYNKFGKTYGQQAASEYLNSLGIPGIKYFDGDSRAAGKGTRNYVVFDEKNITALERDGESLVDMGTEGKYNADLEVPGDPILEGSEITATVRSYAEVMEEFDAEEQLWKDFETCMVGLADGK